MTFSRNLSPILLQPSIDAYTDYSGLQLYASGWGTMGTNGPVPTDLQWVYLRGISNVECRALFGTVVNENTICARFYNNTAQSICEGDSGGPLVHVNFDGSPVLVGVASFVVNRESGGCHSGHPGGFIRPGPFHSWFQQVTGYNFDTNQTFSTPTTPSYTTTTPTYNTTTPTYNTTTPTYNTTTPSYNTTTPTYNTTTPSYNTTTPTYNTTTPSYNTTTPTYNTTTPTYNTTTPTYNTTTPSYNTTTPTYNTTTPTYNTTTPTYNTTTPSYNTTTPTYNTTTPYFSTTTILYNTTSHSFNEKADNDNAMYSNVEFANND
ncbi:uncharacterized protein LOC126967775 isoform X2 [Leptidea sinapis]|uniref:uncharacterized protein LOC126967775 isoform X2 n=1 Tax=Leptidea sinapis TaxID=189913 RepID=UPI0021C2CC3F|nr:uncharacterized protein LOC126967775 isoform X2 [Leptidea sinapis]